MRRQSVLVSWGCCNKLSHTRWLKTKIFIFMVQEASIMKLSHLQGWFLLEGVGEKPARLGGCLESLVFLGLRCIPLISASVFTWHSLLCVSVSSPHLIRSPVFEFRDRSNPFWPHLNYSLKDSISKYSHILSFWVDRILGDNVQPTT